MNGQDAFAVMTRFWQQQTEMALEFSRQAAQATTAFSGLSDTPPPENMPFGQIQSAIADSMAASTQFFTTFWKEFTAPGSSGEAGVPTLQWFGRMFQEDSVANRIAEGSPISEWWQFEKLFAEVRAAWLVLQERGAECGSLVFDTFLEANLQFGDALTAYIKAGKPVMDAATALSVWGEVTNHLLTNLQRREDFLESQAALLRSTADLKLAQQKIVDRYADLLGIPTRGEIDDVHRSLTQLRREVRILQKKIEAEAAEMKSPTDQRSENNVPQKRVQNATNNVSLSQTSAPRKTSNQRTSKPSTPTDTTVTPRQKKQPVRAVGKTRKTAVNKKSAEISPPPKGG